MSILFDNDGHLSLETLEKLKLGKVNDEEMLDVLEHISKCSMCAMSFADSFNDDELEQAPSGFQEQVQSKIKDKKQNNIQFGLYCTKVAVAAFVALMMVFSSGLNFLANTKPRNIKPPNLSITNSVNAKLNAFSEKIIKMEVFNNDKEKK